MRKYMDGITVLYIAGYGRSGSTLLDVVLGSHDRAVGVGELVFLGEEWLHAGRSCACGEDYMECPYWRDVFTTSQEARELTRLVRRVESRSRLLHLVAGAIPEQVRRAYRTRMRALFSHIAKRSGANLVIDSSKSARRAAGRFWALRNIAGLDVRVLHLARDGRDVLRSVAEKGTNWAAEGYRKEKKFLAVRTLVGWGLANSLAWMLGKSLGENRYLRVRFEDLLSHPESTLKRIGSFAGVDLSSVIQRVSSDQVFPVGHNVGGNRIRREKSIRIRRKDKRTRRPWSGLELRHRVLFGLFGQALNTALGYDW